MPSTYDPGLFGSRAEWQHAIAASDVRLQWDPDHEPSGRAVERRAIPLGLWGKALAGFRGKSIISIEDFSNHVASQRIRAKEPEYTGLITPSERPFSVDEPVTKKQLRLDDSKQSQHSHLVT